MGSFVKIHGKTISAKCLYSCAMLNPSDLDQKAVAQRFERLGLAISHGRSIERIDFYLREVERRMLDRLSWTKLVPENILDVGCGRGKGLVALQQLFPSATAIGVDLAFGMMKPSLRKDDDAPMASRLSKLFNQFSSRPKSIIQPKPLFVQADSGHLPLLSDSFDLVWSNLMFHWLPDAQISVQEWFRVIRPGGLLSFTALGVDTFKELKELGLPLMDLPDMHDIGDLLMKSGFSEPVMDQQKLVLTYTDASKLIEEIGSFGGHVQRARPKFLKADRRWVRSLQALEALRSVDGKISVTTEIVFGHTWAPARKKLADGWLPLEMRPYSRSTIE
jgi:malonyl-CoA O-methyltransferase